MTALAFDRQSAVNGCRRAHRAAEAAGRRSGMAAITGCTVACIIENHSGCRIDYLPVMSVHGLGHRGFHMRVGRNGQRIGVVASCTKNGGIIGIGLYEYATCGKTTSATVRAIRHVVNLVGINHVALGSDFDGATETLTDVTGLSLLTEALLNDGFNENEIKAIMGTNALRVLSKNLPQN